MSGAFAKWQPRYAEQGIATFPVKDKRPCVRGWQNVGLRGSRQLVSEFGGADAFGFQCGARNRITIVDIDSNDGGIVDEAVNLFGNSPVLWRTGSGNFAMPFRYGGETRRIRPFPELPIDVLGGGYAVAPPSVGASGRYEFLRGEPHDFNRLPALRLPANENKPWRGLCEGDGRHNHLLNATRRIVRQVDAFDDLLDWAQTRNAEILEPLPHDEVIEIVEWCWDLEESGNNWLGRRGMFIDHDEYERIRKQGGPDAWLLYSDLRYRHWARDFVLSKAMAASLGWGLPRFYSAREALLRLGIIRCKHAGGKGPHDPPTYA